MEKDKKIRLAFNCDQKWDDMSLTDKGRFCKVCNKEVIDYTNYSDLQFLKSLKDKGSLCGRFKVEQVDTTLLKPIEVPQKARLFAFISALFVFTGSKSFSNTQPVKTELSNVHHSNLYDHTINAKTHTTVFDNDDETKNKKAIFTTKRKKYYWSKRFPFIKGVRRVYVDDGLTGRYLN